MKLFKSVGTIVVIVMLALFMGGSVFAADKININTATEAELQSLKKIGPVLAKAIVEYRKANGLFKAPEEITAVKGIGDKIYEMNKDMIIIVDPKPTVADQNEPADKPKN